MEHRQRQGHTIGNPYSDLYKGETKKHMPEAIATKDDARVLPFVSPETQEDVDLVGRESVSASPTPSHEDETSNSPGEVEKRTGRKGKAVMKQQQPVASSPLGDNQDNMMIVDQPPGRSAASTSKDESSTGQPPSIERQEDVSQLYLITDISADV